MSASVAYVLTHYPRVAQTFIAREIEELERIGRQVLTISMNEPGQADLDAPGGRAARDRTFYVKRTRPAEALAATIRAARRSPLGFARLAWRAARSAGTDAKGVVWRLLHLVEAAVMWDHLRHTDARHLHAHFGQTPATLAWFAAEIGNLDSNARWTWSFTVHGFHDFVNEREIRLDLKAASASFVVGVSDFTRSQLMRVSDPRHWDRIAVVRCGIDLDDFPVRDPRPVPRRPRIVTVARLSPEKGHVVLLDALRLLHERGIDATVELVGSGEFAEAIRHQAVHAGLIDHVAFVGELPPGEVVGRLAEADVFCLPSFAEGLPVSIMEAMAVGVPVVTTLISGIPELADDHRTALTVPAGNAEALAEALAELVADPYLGERLAKAARAEVETHHSIGRNVEHLAHWFEHAQGRG
jgi:colanic acid/amylovoran biosynthesis glycosyltransferase